MRLPWSKDKPTSLNGQIERLLTKLDAVEVDSNEYRKLLVRLDRLHRMKTQERREPVSRDMLIQVGGNLLGVLTIVLAERKYTITSKALGEIWRARRP